MPGIDALIATADRSIYYVASYKYGAIGGFVNLPVNRGGCNTTQEGACRIAAYDAWNACNNPPGLGACTPQELATGIATISNLTCAAALAARRQCTQQRDFALDMCTLQHGCAPGNTCTGDAWWGFRGGYGTCCPSGYAACGGRCIAPCLSPRVLDPRTCQCSCPPVSCTPPLVVNPNTCTCTCPPQQCTGGKVLDPVSCTCKCQPPNTDCGICVDTSKDPMHCGACNHACATGEGCCSGVCTPLDTDQNCGVCGNQCGTGRKCCNRICTQLGTTQNCSDCGHRCVGGRICQNNNCVCPSGQIPCGPMAICTPANRCCNNVICAATETCCGGQCVDTRTNNAHCGGCNKPCIYGKVCSNSVCVCPAGKTPCHDYCMPIGWTCLTNHMGSCQSGPANQIVCPGWPGGPLNGNAYCCAAGATCCQTGTGCC